MPVIFIYLLFLIILGFYLRNLFTTLQGNLGEKVIQKSLLKLNSKNYKILNDLLLPSNGYTKYTQIDHLIISKYGIFIIETKAHSGKIYGTEKDKYWTESFYRRTHQLYNPVRQNYAHKKSIERIIHKKYPRVPIFCIIVFPFCLELNINGTNEAITKELLIPKIQSHQIECLTNLQITDISNLIFTATITGQKARKQHIQNIKSLN